MLIQIPDALLRKLEDRFPGQSVEHLVERGVRMMVEPALCNCFTADEKNELVVMCAYTATHLIKHKGGIPAMQAQAFRFIERVAGRRMFPSSFTESSDKIVLYETRDISPDELSFLLFAQDFYAASQLGRSFRKPIRARMSLVAAPIAS